jgi:membrane protein required for colicin V production
VSAFDAIVLLVLGISVLLAFVRGFVREVFSIAAWVVALILAFKFAGTGTQWVPGDMGAAAKHAIAFVVILVLALIAGGLLATLLSTAVRAAGLGFADRLLGAVFGFARGALLVLLGVLIAGLTSLPKTEWWQNAALARPAVAAALALAGWLPRAWAERLDYSGTAPMSKHRGVRAASGTRPIT